MRRLTRHQGVFMISVAAELAEMHPQTLRMYEDRGLIKPQRSPKGTRLYSQEDVDRLRRIQELTCELGMNLAGVERVFELEAQIERMQRRVRRARGEGRGAGRGDGDGARGGPPLVPRRDRALRGAGDGARAGRRAPLAPRALRQHPQRQQVEDRRAGDQHRGPHPRPPSLPAPSVWITASTYTAIVALCSFRHSFAPIRRRA